MRTLSVLNKLFTMAIIFSMINLNIAINIEQARFNISSTQAYAQAPEDPAPEGEPERDPQQSSSGGSMESQEVRSNDGTVVLENTQETDTDAITQKRKEMSGTYNKEEADGFFSSSGIKAINVILLLGFSLIFTKIFVTFQPSKPVDLWIAAAGAAVYLWGEINSAMKANESLDGAKKKLTYEGLDEDATVDVSQKQMLEEEKNILSTAKDAAEKKLKFQRAASAMFAASGISAVIQAAMIESAGTACVTATTTPCPLGAPLAGGILWLQKLSANSAKSYSATAEYVAELNAVFPACLSAASASGPAAPAVITAIEGAQTACALFTERVISNSGGKFAPTPVSSIEKKSNDLKAPLFFTLLSRLISKSHASGKASGIALVIGLVGGMLMPADMLVGNWIFSPILRSVLWGAMSSLALMTSLDTKNQVDALDENIKKIDAILKKFKSAQAVTKVATRQQQAKLSRFGAYQPIKLNEEIPCIGGLRKIKTNNGTKACPSAEKYLVNASRGIESAGFNMPGGFTGAMVDASNGMSGVDTITPKTQQALDVLGTNANAMNKKAKDVLKKVIDRQKGKSKDQLNKTLAAFDKSLGKLAKNANQRRGGGLMAALPSMSNDIKKADEIKDDILQDGLAAKAKGGSGIGKYKAPKAEKFKFDFGADDAEAYAAQKHAQFDETAQAVANMEETPDGEIIEDKSVDIWKVISVRYKKTAYDRLLKRIE